MLLEFLDTFINDNLQYVNCPYEGCEEILHPEVIGDEGMEFSLNPLDYCLVPYQHIVRNIYFKILISSFMLCPIFLMI
jgi:hypothetical protein